jgi:hypothetical protein
MMNWKLLIQKLSYTYTISSIAKNKRIGDNTNSSPRAGKMIKLDVHFENNGLGVASIRTHADFSIQKLRF